MGVSVPDKKYDLSQLETMSNGDLGFVKNIATVFISDAKEQLKLLKEALAKEDYEQLYQVAHKIKPSLILFGIGTVTKEIQEAEKLAQQKVNINILNELLSHVIREVKEVVEQLEFEFK